MAGIANSDGRTTPVASRALGDKDAAEIYDAVAWLAYAAMFLVIPFTVLLFRLQMHAAHYYLAGAMFLACAILFFAMDSAATRVRECEDPPGSCQG